MQPGKTYLLYRQECFTGKYTTRKIHKNYIRDPSGFILHNLRREFIDDVISVISLLNFILSKSFCLCNKKNIPQRLEDMNFVFSCQKQYCFATRKIKFINSRHRVISPLSCQRIPLPIHPWNIVLSSFKLTEASSYLYEEKLFV